MAGINRSTSDTVGRLATVQLAGNGLVKLSDRMADYNKSKWAPKFVRTGIAKVDAHVGGMYCGVLNVVGARPNVGKSFFLHNIVAGSNAESVLFLSLEESWEETCWRLSQSGRDMRYTDKVYFSDCMRNPHKIAKALYGYDLVVVDYLNRLDGCRTEKGAIDEMLEVLSDAVRGTDTALVMAAQLNRSGFHAPGKDGDMIKPTVKELKGSGNIEELAKLILLLHRPPTTEYVNRMDIVVAKASRGKRDLILDNLHFDGAKGIIR